MHLQAKEKLSPAAKKLYIVPFKSLENSKAWKMTSQLVRLKAKNRCYTCNSYVPFERLHAGHAVEKIGHSGIYFDIDSAIRAQCFRCNRVLHGNYSIYAAKLIKEIGQERYEAMHKRANRPKVWTKWDLEELAKIREKEVEILKLKQLQENG